MTRLPLTINIRFGEETWERIGLLKPGTGLFWVVTWRKGKIISRKKIINFLRTVHIFYIDPQIFFRHYVDNSYFHTKWNFDWNKKESLKNLWQRMILLSDFFQYSLVLIPKRKCLVRGSRFRCWESGTLSTIIYTRWTTRDLECHAPMVSRHLQTIKGTRTHNRIVSSALRFRTNSGFTASHCVILRHTASYSGAEGFTETNVVCWSNTCI